MLLKVMRHNNCGGYWSYYFKISITQPLEFYKLDQIKYKIPALPDERDYPKQEESKNVQIEFKGE